MIKTISRFQLISNKTCKYFWKNNLEIFYGNPTFKETERTGKLAALRDVMSPRPTPTAVASPDPRQEL